LQQKRKRTNIEIPFKSLKEAKKNVISEILSSNADKSKLLKESEIVRFTKELCDINARDSLVCWMMWEFQCTIHEILSITINDIDLSKNILKDKKNNFLGEIRQDLKPCILAQKKDKTGTDFLFTTREGKTMHASQIVRNMKIASQRAKLPFIYSPKLLYADAKAYARRTFLSLPEEERTRLCLKMATKN
jgi:site-specific recombinase XerD